MPALIMATRPGRSPVRRPAGPGCRSGSGLVDGFTDILRGCATLLKPGGIVVVTARPWRKHGDLVDLPSAVIAAVIAAGLRPIERCIALLSAVRDGAPHRASLVPSNSNRSAKPAPSASRCT
jgi:hypothetical protein